MGQELTGIKATAKTGTWARDCIIAGDKVRAIAFGLRVANHLEALYNWGDDHHIEKHTDKLGNVVEAESKSPSLPQGLTMFLQKAYKVARHYKELVAADPSARPGMIEGYLT